MSKVLTEIQAESFAIMVSISLNQQNVPREDVRTRLETAEKHWHEYEAGERTRERRLYYIKKLGYLNKAKKIQLKCNFLLS